MRRYRPGASNSAAPAWTISQTPGALSMASALAPPNSVRSVEEMISQLLDGRRIEHFFETCLQVLRDPAVANPIYPVAIRVTRRRRLSLGDLEVDHLSVAFLRISLIDPNDHFGCNRTDLVFIVDQVVSFPTGGNEEAQIGQEARIDTASLEPCAGNPVSSDVPDGQQGGHDSHALLIARCATITEDVPVAPEPGRVQRQPPRHGIHQGHLEVERGLVTGDPVLAEALQHRTDVLVLELDRPLGPVVQQRQQRATVFGLAVAAPGDVVGQHREVIRDDQVVLFICPRAVRHCARLWARSLFVIRDFWQGLGSLRTLPPDLGSAATEPSF